MKYNLVILCCFIASLSFAQSTQPSKLIAKNVGVNEFSRLMKERPGFVLDVRTKGEVEKGAIQNSVNYDIFSDTFEKDLEKIDKSKPVYVYCASGGRSGEAMEMMNKKGYKEVYNLEGGYNAWKKASMK